MHHGMRSSQNMAFVPCLRQKWTISVTRNDWSKLHHKPGILHQICRSIHNKKTEKTIRSNTPFYTTEVWKQKHPFVPEITHTYTERDLHNVKLFITRSRRLFVLTGAGVSTESGIRDYRSEKVGLYAVSDTKPIQYDDFMKSSERRHTFWARNFFGWPLFSNKRPNNCHLALSKLEVQGKVHWLVTQNVDGLHFKAGSQRVTELHGSASRVICMNCNAEQSRQSLQQKLLTQNNDLGVSINLQAPDGDVEVPDEFIQQFQMVSCEECGGILKPKIVFFGEDIKKEIKSFISARLAEADAMLVIGSSVTVFSSYRLLLSANEQGIPICIVNIGKTRGDHLASLRLNAVCGDVLSKIVEL